jgi:hypothetical protein
MSSWVSATLKFVGSASECIDQPTIGVEADADPAMGVKKLAIVTGISSTKSFNKAAPVDDPLPLSRSSALKVIIGWPSAYY